MFPGLLRAGVEVSPAHRLRSGIRSKVSVGGGGIERLWRGYGIVSRTA